VLKKSLAVVSALLLQVALFVAMPVSSANAAAIVLNMSGKSIKFNQTTSPTPTTFTTSTSNDTTRYRNVATVDGITIDAVIVHSFTNAGSFTLDVTAGGTSAVSAAPAGSTASMLAPQDLLQTNVTSTSANGFVQMNFKFYEAGTYTGPGTGSQVTLTNLTINSYDLDDLGGKQFTEFQGFQTYQVSASPATTTLAVANGTGTGWVRFIDSTSGGNYGDTTGSYTKGRVLVTYDQLSELSVRHGTNTANGSGRFALDFGPGYEWKDSVVRTTTTNNNPNNSAPTSAAKTIYYTSGTPWVFSEYTVPTSAIASPNNYFDFPYSDPENNAFASVKIVTLPASGNLQKLVGSTWTNITAGDSILVTDIQNGNFRYNGTGSQSFTFKVYDGQALSASAYTMTLSPSTLPQQITFNNPGTKQVSATPFASGAVTNATGLTPTLYSLTPSTCTVSGLNITAVANGTCTIIAIQLGNSTYSQALPVVQSFSISPLLNQVITLNNPGTQTVSSSLGVAPSTSAPSAQALVVSLASLTTAVCTVTGSAPTYTVNHISQGNCTLYATQGGNASYAPASPVQVTYLVNAGSLGNQMIAFNQPGNINTTTTSVSLTASATSGLPVTFTSSTPSVCTVSGSTVTILGPGTCTITAQQGGNGSWAAATPVTLSFYVLEITTASLPSGVAGTAYSTTLAAFQGATGVYTWAVNGTCLSASSALTLNTSTGVISGNSPVAGTYTCTYSATDSGVTATKSLTIVIAASAPPAKTANAITWAQLPNVSITNGTITLGATSNGSAASPATVIYYTSNTPSVCTVSGNVVTILTSGYCELTADDDGNATYDKAAQVTNAFNIFEICTPAIGGGFENQPYTETFQTLGTVGAGTFSLTGGLPTGLSLDPNTGVLSGTPSQPWNGSITVTYTQGSSTHSRTYTLIINAAPGTPPAPGGGGGGGTPSTPTPTPTPTPTNPAEPTPTPTPTPTPEVKELKAIAFFSGDSTKFVGNSKTVINNLASNIKAEAPTSVTIVVAGYVNKTNDTSYDTKLALARAKATVALLAKQGIEATVQVVAKGIHPTTGTSARRAEITVKLTK
jgi:outer membrane protein OmpA-like peptidoglycan-associated protein